MDAALVTRTEDTHGVRRRIAVLRGARHGGVVLYMGSVALVAVAYYLAGRLGLELAYLDGAVAALWPPAGLGLAVLFLYGVRLWPGIVLGDLLLADFSTPFVTVVGQTVGNTLALVIAALLLRRLTGGRGELERVVDVLALVACAFLAAIVSAAFGPTSLRLGDVIAADELGRVFRTWTLGDASGVLVIAPFVMTWAVVGFKGIRRRDLVEGAVLIAVLVALAELPSQRDVPYIVFPVLLWAALRFGPRGAATAILVVCSITVWNTAHSDGPFVRDSLTDSLLATQLFIAISALTSLLLAAVTAERTRAARALVAAEAAQRALADEQAALRRVATLVAGEAPPSRVFERVTEEVGRLLGLPGAIDHALRRRAPGNGRRRLERGRRAALPGRCLARPRRRHGRREGAAQRQPPTRGPLRGGERDAGPDRAGLRLPRCGCGAGHRRRKGLGRAGGGDDIGRRHARGPGAAAVRLRRARRAGAGQR